MEQREALERVEALEVAVVELARVHELQREVGLLVAREVTLFTDDDLKGGEQIIAFITNLRNLNNLKIKPRGDLDVLSAINKNVQTVHICTPEQSETLETVKRFLARNKQADLTLQFMNPSELNYGDF